MYPIGGNAKWYRCYGSEPGSGRGPPQEEEEEEEEEEAAKEDAEAPGLRDHER